MRPIMFSPVFPKYHPKAGQPTYFVEKVWKSLVEMNNTYGLAKHEAAYNNVFPCQYTKNEIVDNHEAKSHTIRAGNRWKVGDYFSPRIWSDKAYRSPQIEFAPPIKIEKIWQFIVAKEGYRLSGNGWTGWLGLEMLSKIARNDGLSVDDLEDWFAPYGKKDPEECQIICWNKNIEYSNPY